MSTSRPLRQPIVASVAYEFASFQHCRDTYAGKVDAHAYSRISNPTVEDLEHRIAALLGGKYALGFASGMAALSALFMTLCRPGQNIIASPRLYGGTIALLSFLREFGIDTRYVDFHDVSRISDAIDDHSVMLFSEPIANPSMATFDYAQVAELSRNRNIMNVFDNTNTVALFPTLRWADVEVVSATKYIGGHGAAVGGLIIAGPIGAKMSRVRHFHAFCADLAYQSPLSFGAERALPLMLRKSTLRNTGACMSPFNAFIFALGLDTLKLRMRDISQRTYTLACFLRRHPKVEIVFHPALGSEADAIGAFFPEGTGGLFSVCIRGGRDAVEQFFAKLETIPIATNIGDRVTIVQHVETTSHSQLTAAEAQAAGIQPNLLRVSVGLEPADELIAEFGKALM